MLSIYLKGVGGDHHWERPGLAIIHWQWQAMGLIYPSPKHHENPLQFLAQHGTRPDPSYHATIIRQTRSDHCPWWLSPVDRMLPTLLDGHGGPSLAVAPHPSWRDAKVGDLGSRKSDLGETNWEQTIVSKAGSQISSFDIDIWTETIKLRCLKMSHISQIISNLTTAKSCMRATFEFRSCSGGQVHCPSPKQVRCAKSCPLHHRNLKSHICLHFNQWICPNKPVELTLGILLRIANVAPAKEPQT